MSVPFVTTSFDERWPLSSIVEIQSAARFSTAVGFATVGARLNQEQKYVSARNLTDATGEFASSNLPNGWLTRYDAAQHKLILYFQRGTVIMVR